jgi:mRNA interferase MazF
MGIEQGDIVLVPVPFTDLSSQKRRPVIVISNDNYNLQSTDVVVVAMTSNPAVTSYSFILTPTDLIKGSLNRPGTVRVDKIYTLAQSIVVNKFGKVSPNIVKQIRQVLDSVTLPSSSASTP